jgi:hypothetical protein
MSGNISSLVVIVGGIAFTLYRTIKNRNQADLTFLPFWFFMGWMLFAGSSPMTGVIAVVLLIGAIVGRWYIVRKVAHNLPERAVTSEGDSAAATMPSEEEWEKIVGPLRQALDGTPATAPHNDYENKAPKDVPYTIIPEITGPEWAELLRHANNQNWNPVQVNEYLWGYLYRLHHWTYIDLAPPLSAGTTPYCVTTDDKPSLLFFTSEDLATAFMESRQIRDKHPQACLMSFILPGTLPVIQGYQAQGITWLCFNPESEAGPFGQPIEMLQTCYWWFMEYDTRFKSKETPFTRPG